MSSRDGGFLPKQAVNTENWILNSVKRMKRLSKASFVRALVKNRLAEGNLSK